MHNEKSDCPCPRGCTRHGDCTACERRHAHSVYPVYCRRKDARAQKRCVVVAGGPLSLCDQVRVSGDFVIACDAGYTACAQLGLRPDLVVGDFDSYGGPVDPSLPVSRMPAEKDDTDTLAGLKLGLARGYRDFVMVAAFGGRLDHTIANLQALVFLCENGARGTILSNDNQAWAVRNGSIEIERMDGWHLSVFAADGPCEGVTLEHVAYPLRDAVLTPSFPLGVSNEFCGEAARISVKRGTLLIVASKERLQNPAG